MDDADLIERAISPAARSVCEVLQAGGHEAYAVGGAVRDALLGRGVGDWDVATSAAPDEVAALFRRTIPTGVEHGTITVVIGAGRGREAVEVTTYRGEGAYSDARRPDEVHFGVALEEDLARRDFVINAIAFDPIARTVVDPFGGRSDLARGLVRAVGDPAERFREDGLRVMRAIRFVSQLGFELGEDTESAIPAASSSLARVARERVHAELAALLVGPAADRALAVGRRTGALEASIPELGAPIAAASEPDWEETLLRVRAAPREAALRLVPLVVLGARRAGEPGAGDGGPGGSRGRVLGGRAIAGGLEDSAAGERAEAVMRGLRASAADRGRVRESARFFAAPGRAAIGAPAMRRVVAATGRARVADLAALWRADAAVWRPGKRVQNLAESAEVATAVLARGDPAEARDLAISGRDVIRALGIAPGPAVGEILEDLAEAVRDEPARNTPAELETLARRRARARGLGDGDGMGR